MEILKNKKCPSCTRVSNYVIDSNIGLCITCNNMVLLRSSSVVEMTEDDIINLKDISIASKLSDDIVLYKRIYESSSEYEYADEMFGILEGKDIVTILKSLLFKSGELALKQDEDELMFYQYAIQIFSLVNSHRGELSVKEYLITNHYDFVLSLYELYKIYKMKGVGLLFKTLYILNNDKSESSCESCPKKDACIAFSLLSDFMKGVPSRERSSLYKEIVDHLNKVDSSLNAAYIEDSGIKYDGYGKDNFIGSTIKEYLDTKFLVAKNLH